MGVCFSTIKVSGSSSNNNTTAIAGHHYHRKERTDTPQSTTTNKQSSDQKNIKDGNNSTNNGTPESTQLQTKPKQQQRQQQQQQQQHKVKEKQTSRRQSGVIPCGKRTDFGYAKDFDRRYMTGKLLGHGQFGYTYVATDKANGDRVAVKRIEKNKVFLLFASVICFCQLGLFGLSMFFLWCFIAYIASF